MPYPHNSPQAQVAATSSSHLSATARFAKAFSEAQTITLERGRFGLIWPLLEFWHDRLEDPMKIVHELIDPIVVDVVAKRKGYKENADAADHTTDHEKTLLEELASSTDGNVFFLS